MFDEKTKTVTNKINLRDIGENILKDSGVNSNFRYPSDNATCRVDE